MNSYLMKLIREEFIYANINDTNNDNTDNDSLYSTLSLIKEDNQDLNLINIVYNIIDDPIILNKLINILDYSSKFSKIGLSLVIDEQDDTININSNDNTDNSTNTTKNTYVLLSKFFKKLYKKRFIKEISLKITVINTNNSSTIDLIYDFLSKINNNIITMNIDLILPTNNNNTNNDTNTNILSNILKSLINTEILYLNLIVENISTSKDFEELTELINNKNSKLQSLSIKGLTFLLNDPTITNPKQIKYEIFGILSNLNSSKLNTIDLSSNNLNYWYLSNWKPNFSINLRNIDLSDNNINTKGIQMFYNAINLSKINTNNISSLNLSYNNIGDSGMYYINLIILLCKKLSKLNLAHNSIYFIGIERIKEGILGNKNLSVINLAGNHISSIGVKLLCDYLVHEECENTSISRLVLSYNRINYNTISNNSNNTNKSNSSNSSNPYLALSSLLKVYIKYSSTITSIELADNELNDNILRELLNNKLITGIISNNKGNTNTTNTTTNTNTPPDFTPIRNLESINLSFNTHLSSDSMLYLNDLLLSNPIKILHLEYNNFNNTGIEYITDNLKLSTCIKEIYLTNNHISNSGRFTFSRRPKEFIFYRKNNTRG